MTRSLGVLVVLIISIVPLPLAAQTQPSLNGVVSLLPEEYRHLLIQRLSLTEVKQPAWLDALASATPDERDAAAFLLVNMPDGDLTSLTPDFVLRNVRLATLNDPSDTDRDWSVEVAIPWAGLAAFAGDAPCLPKDGQQWRVDFSRVEWLVDIIDGKYRKIPRESRPEDNWVWSPQGVIDMHRPERWGYVQFSASPQTATFKPDPALATRDALMTVYHRQREFQKRFGHFAATLDELDLSGSPIRLESTGSAFTATLTGWHVRQDSKLWYN